MTTPRAARPATSSARLSVLSARLAALSTRLGILAHRPRSPASPQRAPAGACAPRAAGAAPASSTTHRASAPARAAALALLAGLLLGPAAVRAELEIVDDSGRHLRLAGPAQRIVSLAPHVTELLFAAGAGDRVVGVVEYSDYPPAARALPRVGGYSRVDLEAVAALTPDLVIGWQSGNREAHLERLGALGIAVYLNEPRSLDDVARSLEQLGRLAGTSAAADAAAREFRTRRDTLAARYRERPPVRTFYQIWEQPLMTVNDRHLIADVIRLCGGRNVFGELPALAPRIGEEAVLAADPEVIVASGMGEARPEWLERWTHWPALAAVRAGNLFFVPPDLIQRHTPRILDGAERLCAQLETARERRGGPQAADATASDGP